MEFILKLAFQWKLSAKFRFLEHILSETGIFIKLTKNLLFFLSSLRRRSSIKKSYILSFARKCHPSPPVYLHLHFNGISPPPIPLIPSPRPLFYSPNPHKCKHAIIKLWTNKGQIAFGRLEIILRVHAFGLSCTRIFLFIDPGNKYP